MSIFKILTYDGVSSLSQLSTRDFLRLYENWADEIDDHQTAFLTAFNVPKRL
jgi:hypothetical protein